MITNYMQKLSDKTFSKTISVFFSALILPTSLIVIPQNHNIFSSKPDIINPCNCVIFRLDDIQDFDLNQEQVEIMNFFILRGLHVSLGLVMNYIGNDTVVLNKISEGSKMGLFELALHGWNHIDYTTLGVEEQKKSLYKANEKMKLLFGNKSSLFFAPYNKFDADTLWAMNVNGIKVLSSSLEDEYKFNSGKSIFTVGKNNTVENIYHVPYTTDFEKYIGNTQLPIPASEILTNIIHQIQKYGYAIVLIHPQSFIKLDKFGTFQYNNRNATLDTVDIQRLEILINSIQERGIAISSFNELIKSNYQYIKSNYQ